MNQPINLITDITPDEHRGDSFQEYLRYTFASGGTNHILNVFAQRANPWSEWRFSIWVTTSSVYTTAYIVTHPQSIEPEMRFASNIGFHHAVQHISQIRNATVINHVWYHEHETSYAVRRFFPNGYSMAIRHSIDTYQYVIQTPDGLAMPTSTVIDSLNFDKFERLENYKNAGLLRINDDTVYSSSSIRDSVSEIFSRAIRDWRITPWDNLPILGINTTTTTESETEMSNEEEEIITVTCVRNSRNTQTGTVEELESDGWRQIDGDWYSENYWFTCVSCDDSFSTYEQDGRSSCDEPWCENCGSDIASCDDCGGMITDEYDQVTLRAGRYDYQTYHRDCQPESHYCNHHEEECVGDFDDCSYCHRTVLSYSTKFDDLDGLFFHNNGDISRRATPGVVYLGVEHEMLNERRSRDAMADIFTDRINDHYAILKDDGSVGDEGFEYVSQPMTLETHRNFSDYWQWVDECKADGFIAWDAKDRDDKLKCGIHIHVSRTGFTNRSHTARFVLAVYKFQDEMVKFSGRRSKRWADYAEYERMQFVDRAKGMSNPNRYVAVNCQNEHTIELRIFRSSMVKETVLAYMEITDALVEWTRTLNCRDHYDGKFDFAQFREWLNDKPQYAHCADRIDRRVTRVITEV